MDIQNVIETVGKMVAQNSKPVPDDRAAREAFDNYVLAVAKGQQATELSEGQLRVLQACDRRSYDMLPNEVSAVLGFVEGKTYRDAINLCERQWAERAKEEMREASGQPRKRVADRRRNDRRRQGRISEFVSALRRKLSH
jgi:hypothetical protein